MEQSKFRVLMALLLAHQHNFKIIHWNSKGETFDYIHELVNNHTEKLMEFTDEVTEVAIACNERPIHIIEVRSILEECDKDFTVLSPDSLVSIDSVFKSITSMLKELVDMYDEVSKCNMHPAFLNKLQEHQYWLLLESDYKGKRRLQ